MKTRAFALATSLLFGIGCYTVHSATLTWTGSVSTDWNNPANWTPQQVPTASDHAIISSNSVTIPSSATYAILDISGGSASGSFGVAGNGVLNWSGGAIGPNGALTVASNGVLNVLGAAEKDLYVPLTNWGSVVWTGGGQWRLFYQPGYNDFGSIFNLAGGLFDIQNDALLNYYSGNELFSNAGTLRKSAGAGTTTFNPQISNTGSVDVESGTLAFATGGIIDGQFYAAAGSAITFNGTFTSGNAPLLSGAGAFQFTGGTLTLLHDVIPNLQMLGGTLALGPAFQGGSITNLTLTGMQLSGNNTVTGTATLGAGSTGNLTVAGNGVLNWSGGAIGPNGALTVASNGVLNVLGAAEKDLYVPLTNWGSVVWTGGGQWRLFYQPGYNYFGSIFNLAGGLFDIQNDALLNYYSGNELFSNAGTLRKSAGAGTTTFNPQISNTGSVDVESGTLAFATGGIIDGQFYAAAGSAITFNGTFTSGNAPLLSGAGAFQFTGGTLTLLHDVIPNLQMLGGTLALGPAFQGGSITNLTLAGMQLSGNNTVSGTATLGAGSTGNLTVAGNGVLNWSGGAIGPNGALTVASNGVLNVLGAAEKDLYVPLTNWGSVVWTGGGQWRLFYQPGYNDFGSIFNLAGGLFDIQNDALLNYYSGNELFSNAGTLRKSAGAGTTTFNPQISNTGSVDVESGTLAFATGGIIDGQFYAAAGSAITFNGTFTSGNAPLLSGAGAFQFTGGTLTLLHDVIPNLQMLGGTLALGPAFQGGSITNLTLTGTELSGNNTVTGTATLGAGSTGNLTVAGNGVLNWSGGAIGPNGALTVASNGVLNVLGAAEKDLYVPLTNWGSVVWTGGGQWRLFYQPGYNDFGSIFNLAGGLFDIQNDALLNYYSGNELFSNAGTLRKSAGAGTTTFNPQISNTGSVDVESGTLAFATGGIIDGQFYAAAGSAITFNGTFTSGNAPLLSGAGAFQFTGGTLTLLHDVIPNLQMLGGTLALGPAFQGGSITNLTLTGTELSGNNTVTGTATLGAGSTGNLTVAGNGVLNWSGGAIGPNGALTVASNGVLNVLGAAEKDLYVPLTNWGSVVWTGGGQWRLFYQPGYNDFGSIFNLAGGLFDIQNDALLNYYSGNELFSNAGTLRKSAGAGTTTFNPQISNTGSVDVESGTLAFATGGIIDGQFYAAAGSAITFNGTFTSGNAPLLSGAGAFQFTGGTLTLLHDVIPNLQMLGGTLALGPAFQGGSITNLTLTGTELSGNNTVTGTATLGAGSTGNLTVAGNGVLNWSGGAIGPNGALTVASNGVLNVLGAAEKDLYVPLTNWGSVVWTGGGQWRLFYQPGYNDFGSIFNLAGGLFDIQNDALLNYYSGNELFSNAGTLRKSAGAGTTTFNPQISNTGSVDVESGTLAFATGGIIDGQFYAAAGSAITFNGTFTSGNAPLLSGAGAFQFTGGTLTLLHDVIPNLQMLGGTLALGPAFQGGSITNLTLTGMQLSGNNTVTGTATLGAGSTGNLTVAGNGVLNWSGGAIGPNGALTVASNGVLNVLGAAEKDLYVPLTNWGSVVWTGGGQWRLFYQPGYNDFGSIFNLAGGFFDIQNDALLNYYSGNELFSNAGTLRKSAGAGTTTFNPQISNTGLVEADKATISFQSGFTPNSGEMRFGLNSLTDYGKINIAGNAALGGTVGVAWLGGYVPATNNSFTVLTYGSHSGIFTNLDLPPAALWATNYTATSFTLTVAAINKLAFTTQPVGNVLTNTIMPSVVVQIELPIGNPFATSGVPVTLSLARGGGVLSGTLTQLTDSSGKAIFGNLSLDQAGGYTLLATAPNLTPAISNPFAILPLIGLHWTAGGFEIDLNGHNQHGPILVYASTDLNTWTLIFTNPPTLGRIILLDSASTNFSSRFYQVIKQ